MAQQSAVAIAGFLLTTIRSKILVGVQPRPFVA